MSRMPWAAYAWPGLPQLARDGNWTALAVAVVATALLNAILLGTCVWSDLVAPELRIICWIVLGGAWCFSVGYSVWIDRRRESRPSGTDEKLFEQALEEYLKGNWFEAERKLAVLLRQNDRDLESRLLMATLMRHTKRFDEATTQLNLLVRMDGAHRWALEIQREGELLNQARQRNITSVNAELENRVPA